MPAWVTLLVAVIAPGGIIVTLLERLRRENSRDHQTNSQLLRRIDDKVDHLGNRITDHIEWHLDQENNEAK